MRKFLLGVLLIPALASAEPVKVDKPVVCDSFENVINFLTTNYNEKPLLIGSSEDKKVAFVINPKTLTWTLIEYNQTNACLLSRGEGFQFNLPMLEEHKQAK
jgi:hypothetical protein